MTDTLELKIIMLRNGYTVKSLAKHIGISATSLSYKMNNKREFMSCEIKAIQNALHLSNEQRDFIFFAHDVDLKST
ncbi:MAG: helix-turn-helix domain-containing protein [Longibaculum sp.]